MIVQGAITSQQTGKAMAAVLASSLRGMATAAASTTSSQTSTLGLDSHLFPLHAYSLTGSSIREPKYFGVAASETGSGSHLQVHGDFHISGAMEAAPNRPTPTKKSKMLHLLISTPRRRLAGRRRLAPQGAGLQMLPPGCSLSDPVYEQLERAITAGVCAQQK